MIPSLKKINTELARKAYIKTHTGHMVNTCPLKIECKFPEAKEACKNVKEEIEMCSHCYIEWLVSESEV